MIHSFLYSLYNNGILTFLIGIEEEEIMPLGEKDTKRVKEIAVEIENIHKKARIFLSPLS